jgi:hypothetical protein
MESVRYVEDDLLLHDVSWKSNSNIREDYLPRASERMSELMTRHVWQKYALDYEREFEQVLLKMQNYKMKGVVFSANNTVFRSFVQLQFENYMITQGYTITT